MKIILLGKNGQVGWELQRSLAPLGELIAFDSSQADFSKPDSLRKIITEINPDWVVNAAAYTAVDKAESEVELANIVNAKAVQVIAETVSKIGAWLIHYSTDYVYDGKKATEYVETDEVNPLSVYGRTKLAGEKAIQKSGCNHLIFRTSWVFSKRRHNFVKTIIKLSKRTDNLRIVADQYGAPTSAEFIADITAMCIHHIAKQADQEKLQGIYHLVPNGDTSWYLFAKYILNIIQLTGKVNLSANLSIYPIPSNEYPLPAARPENSKLSNDKLKQNFNLTFPNWEFYVDRMLEEINGEYYYYE